MLGRLREAVDSGTWNLEERVEHALTVVDEAVITTKGRSEFKTDVPRQNKRFKLTLDGGDNATAEDTGADDIQEEGGEPTDEHELDE